MTSLSVSRAGQLPGECVLFVGHRLTAAKDAGSAKASG